MLCEKNLAIQSAQDHKLDQKWSTAMLCKEDVAIQLTRIRNFGHMWNPPMLSEDHIAIRMHSLYICLYILSAHNSGKVQYSNAV